MGSSAQTIAGSLTSERAIVTRWRSPPESSSGTCDARSASPTRSSASSARRRALPALSRAMSSGQLDVLDGAQHRHQVVELEDESHVAGAVVGALAVGHLGERRPVDHDLAAVDGVEAGEAVEQRGLAAPARPHDRRHLSALERQVDPAQRLDAHRPRVVRLHDRPCVDDRARAHGGSFRGSVPPERPTCGSMRHRRVRGSSRVVNYRPRSDPVGPWQTPAMGLEAFELVVLRRPPMPRRTTRRRSTGFRRSISPISARSGTRGSSSRTARSSDHPDESVRGLTFFCVGSVEEARRLAEDDPAVRAGRLAVDVMTWWCPAGTMTRPGRPVSVGEHD